MPALPTWNGWTIDERLQELRRSDPVKGMAFVPFASAKGQKLLAQLARAKRGA